MVQIGIKTRIRNDQESLNLTLILGFLFGACRNILVAESLIKLVSN